MRKKPAPNNNIPPPLNPKNKMSETHETILRCLGYGIEFIQLLAVPVVLAAMTRRLAK
jgi:hypothetical protein